MACTLVAGYTLVYRYVLLYVAELERRLDLAVLAVLQESALAPSELTCSHSNACLDVVYS